MDVETTQMEKLLSIDDPALDRHSFAPVSKKQTQTDPRFRSDRAMTDCRPLSIILPCRRLTSLAKKQVWTVDKRRFRANLYVEPEESAAGFAETQFVGKTLHESVESGHLPVLQRDGRCMMITLDPDTAEKSPADQKAVAQGHEGMAGVYGAVLVEGTIRKGDPVELL